MLKGFRDFILRGNVMDLAVAVIIGAAFTAIVTAFTANIINPLLGAFIGKPNFDYLVANVNGGEIKNTATFLTAARQLPPHRLCRLLLPRSSHPVPAPRSSTRPPSSPPPNPALSASVTSPPPPPAASSALNPSNHRRTPLRHLVQKLPQLPMHFWSCNPVWEQDFRYPVV